MTKKISFYNNDRQATFGLHDFHQNDTQHSDMQRNNTQHQDTEQNDSQHDDKHINNTQHNVTKRLLV